MEDDRTLMSVEELADWLQVPSDTPYSWRYRGTGPPGIKVGRYVRYRRKDVEKWLDQQKGPSNGR